MNKELFNKEFEDHIKIVRDSISLSEKILKTSNLIIECFHEGGKVILIGNGGSAADAQHIAAEFIGHFRLERYPLPAIALVSNTSIITALSNDYGYDIVFSRQLDALSNNKDVLIAISTSGNSQNILNAVEIAKLKKLKIIGMTGKTGGKLKDKVDILINIPSEDIPRIQEMHLFIGHIICNLVERNCGHSSIS